MGACATKSKVLKNDTGEAPAPEHAAETAKEEAAGGGAVSETTVENGSDEKVDSKAPSLSHLFEQNEGKDLTENENNTAPDEPQKQEISETEKPAEEKAAAPETKTTEEQHSDLVIQKKTVAEAFHSDQNKDIEPEKVIETSSEEKIIELRPKNGETFEDEKKVEVANDAEKTENAGERTRN